MSGLRYDIIYIHVSLTFPVCCFRLFRINGYSVMYIGTIAGNLKREASLYSDVLSHKYTASLPVRCVI